MDPALAAFWSVDSSELVRRLETTPDGLSRDECEARIARYGLNRLKPKSRSGAAW